MTTTIGVVCHDGVVLTTDTRATMGSFVAHKHAKKVYRIDQHIAMTIAGTVGDAQAIVEMLRANSALYKLDLARPIPINSAARLVSNVLFQSRYYPLGVQALIGGMDDTGRPHLMPRTRLHQHGWTSGFPLSPDSLRP